VVGLFYALVKMILLLLKDRTTTYVYILPHIGDLCYAMSYLREYRNKNSLTDITVITKAQNRTICELYKGAYDHIITLSEIKILQLQYIRIWEVLFEKMHISIMRRFINTIPWPRDRRMYRMKNINASEITKKVVYNLDDNIEPEYPQIQKITGEKLKQFSSYNNLVILSPYANTISPLQEEFWSKLADTIRNKGYIVATNIGPNQKSIPRTIPLQCSIAELPVYADIAYAFIGTRSGVFDLIIGCRCKLVALYFGYSNYNFYNLEGWNRKEYLLQIVNNVDADSIIELIVSDKSNIFS